VTRASSRLLIGALCALPPLGSPSAARAGQSFVGLQAGLSVLKEEGHAPPLCCRERETWTAPGGRLGGQVGYAFGSPFMVRADLGLGLYQVAGQDHLRLRVLSPDAAAYVGAQLRRRTFTLEVAAGAGWRHFVGTAREIGAGAPATREVSTGAADLRLAVGLRVPLGARSTLGGELAVARVILDQTVATLSLTLGWQDR
jgi:hypothetical protein